MRVEQQRAFATPVPPPGPDTTQPVPPPEGLEPFGPEAPIEPRRPVLNPEGVEPSQIVAPPEGLNPPAGLEGPTAPSLEDTSARTLDDLRGDIMGTVFEGSQSEKSLTFRRKQYEVGDIVVAGGKGADAQSLDDPERRYRILTAKPSGEPGLWEYTVQPAEIPNIVPQTKEDHYTGLMIDAQLTDAARAAKVRDGTDGLSNNVIMFTGADGNIYQVTDVPEFYGSPAEQHGAMQTKYLVENALTQMHQHIERETPGAALAYQKAHELASPEDRESYSAMNVQRSLGGALEEMTRLYPETYTQRLSTEAGMEELFNLALIRMTTIAPAGEVNFTSILQGMKEKARELKKPGTGKTSGPKEFVEQFAGQAKFALDIFSIEREGFLQLEEAYIPDVPFLKTTVIKASETFTDPIFLATLPIMPGAGLLGKAAFLTEISLAGAIGEQAAEAAGVNPMVGEIAGMVIGPSALRAGVGFVSAVRKAGIEGARMKFLPGEPASEWLIRNGEVLELPELQKALESAAGVESRPLALSTQGEFTLGKATTLSDGSTVVTGKLGPLDIALNAGASEMEAISVSISLAVKETPSLSNMRNLKAFIQDMQKQNPFRPIEADIANDAVGRVMLSMGAEEISAAGAAQKVMRFPAKRAFSPVAGGSRSGSLLDFLDDLIRIHVERPEAQDMLRSLGEKLASKHPMMKRAVEATNRGVLATTPTLKGAVGIEAMATYDQALRRQVMARFRAVKIPVRQNEKAQIFVPKVAGAKEGEWIAQGDVIEALEQGNKKMLAHFTNEQSEFLIELGRLQNPFVETLELLTGEKLAKRAAHWARFVIDLPKRTVGLSGGNSKLTSWYKRSFEVQQDAIQEFGISYLPDILQVAEAQIASLQRVARDITLSNFLKREGIVKVGKPPTRLQQVATEVVAQMKGVQPGVISIEHMNELRSLLGPASRNIMITGPVKANSVMRLLLTGIMDTGVGTLQLTTLFFTNPAGWGEAMARSFQAMLFEPKSFYRFVSTNKRAAQFAKYGGNIGLESEFSAATRLSLPGREHLPGPVSKAIDIGTFPFRAGINRMQVGFDSALSYGRIFAFDAMAGPMAKPGPLLRAAGARPLEGQALQDEMFRLARFTDTLIGQPELRGIVPRVQEQFESGYLWFAPRYTRSLLGTFSYVFGKGYTPAQARVILSKMMIGGMAIHAGFVASAMQLQGASPGEIRDALGRTFNPLSGKEFMSFKVGKDWFGMGGVYRAAFNAIGTLGDMENWKFDGIREAAFDNAFIKIIRGRTTPITGTFMDFMEGEDFLGRETNFWDLVDDPKKIARYAADNFLPFALSAALQEGGWERKTGRGITEFFGLRSSPETLWESMSPVMDKLAVDRFGVTFEELENNLPAQDYVRNHAKVKAVEEAQDETLFGLPPLTTEQQRVWGIYRDERDKIRDFFSDAKDDLDKAFYTTPLRGSEFRERVRTLATEEYHQLLGMNEALQASLGIDVAGDEDAPAGTVDAALNDYYELDLEDYTDKKTLKVDWDSFFADRDAILERVPEEFKELVLDFIGRHKSRVAKDFTSKFDEFISPSGYFEVREKVAESLDIDLNALENAFITQYKEDGFRASPVDVANDVEKYLNLRRVEQKGEGVPTIARLRQIARENSPELDLELFRQGYVTTVRSLEAVRMGENLRVTKPELGYFKPKLSADVAEDLGL